MKTITIAVDRDLYEKFKVIAVIKKEIPPTLVNKFMENYINKHKSVIKKFKI